MTITTQSEIEAIISQQDFSIRQEVYESNCISLFANNRNIIIDLPIEENNVEKLLKYLKTGEQVNPLKTFYILSFPTVEHKLDDVHFENAFGKGFRLKKICVRADQNYRQLTNWHPPLIEELNDAIDKYFDGKDEFDEAKFKEFVYKGLGLQP
ncbi:hypothetical protein Pam2_71 [Pseudanabaena phage Pam2]|nr:hypothetical protein Pam2_71 [Pseudanabaena phage Pam2]